MTTVKSRGTAVGTAPKGKTRLSVGVQAVKEKRLSLKKEATVRIPWYLKREGELSVVTDEAHNAALGIKLITVFEPTENQVGAGILAKVKMDTLCGSDINIAISESKRNPGEIYLQVSGARKVGETWYRDRTLNDAATAQILSYVHNMLTYEE